MRLPYIALAFALSATPALATDFQALRDDADISSGLRWVAAADAIRNTCPAIGERTWKARGVAFGLLNRAFALGYSMGEATDYVDSEEEQARVKGEAIAYLTQVGAVEGDADSFCAVGYGEIDRGSAIGVLIRRD